MSGSSLPYDKMMQRALRAVMREALATAAGTGLPGGHHFFITFRTRFPGVRIPPRVVQQHPEEMVIVLQHQFWDLVVGEEEFQVTLSFSGSSERLTIPFAAISGFADPFAKFGLQFPVEALAEPPAKEEPPETDPSPPVEPAPAEGGKVIALDAFRKK